MRSISIKYIVVTVLAAVLLCGCEKGGEDMGSQKEVPVGAYGDSIPVTRGEAARMLSLCIYEKDNIYGQEYTSDFSDVKKEDRLYKYINALCRGKIMQGDGGSFRPNDYLTVREASYIIDAADKSGRISLKTDDNTDKSPISYYMWMEILDKLSEADGISGGSETVMTVLMTEYSESSLKGYIITDRGLFATDGYVPQSLENNGVSFLTKDKSIIGIKSVETNTPTLEKCLVRSIDGGRAEVFCGGCRKIFDSDSETSAEEPFIADISIKGGMVEKITPYKNEKKGRVLMAGGTVLFDDGYSYNVDENFFAYSTYDGINRGGLSSLISGCTARVVFSDNKAVCAICEEAPDRNKIRVCISSDKGLYHSAVNIGSDGSFVLKSSDMSSEHSAGETIRLDKSSENTYFRGRLLRISPKGGGVIIDGRNYPGETDIIRSENGYTVVCEMELESYLYGVICSEMPSGWNDEALKAQAIAARTYAVRQLLSNRRIDFGANVDDTTAFQAYSPENICDEAIKAADGTKGQILVFDGEPANTCFFSTSCGTGAAVGELWPDGEVYPSDSPSYMGAKRIGEGGIPDFGSEEKALGFFRLKDEKSLEKDAPYFRWSFTLDPESIGVDDITVTERGKAGNVMKILAEGEDEDREICGESSIRSFICPGTVKLSDNTSANLTALPSSFFAIEKLDDGNLCFYGGGLGHGAGMSQYGAEEMARQGKSCKDILEYFYPGTKTEKL